jgi:hypothetical protein
LLAAGYGPQQTFELAASAAPMAASSSPSWHGASPIYASSCARHYDDWPPNAAVNSAAIAGPAHSPNSPGGQYHKWQIIIKNCACCSFGLFMRSSPITSLSQWSISTRIYNLCTPLLLFFKKISSNILRRRIE